MLTKLLIHEITAQLTCLQFTCTTHWNKRSVTDPKWVHYCLLRFQEFWPLKLSYCSRQSSLTLRFMVTKSESILTASMIKYKIKQNQFSQHPWFSSFVVWSRIFSESTFCPECRPVHHISHSLAPLHCGFLRMSLVWISLLLPFLCLHHPGWTSIKGNLVIIKPKVTCKIIIRISVKKAFN